MYDLSTLDCLDFSEEKWQANGVHEVMSKGDAIYGMRGIAPEPKGGIYFNKRLLEEAGITADSIYELQENGEWTWDKFEELCSQVQADTDNDGVIDRYAMVNFRSTFYNEAVASNYGDYIAMDDKGNFGTASWQDGIKEYRTKKGLKHVYDEYVNVGVFYVSDDFIKTSGSATGHMKLLKSIKSDGSVKEGETISVLCASRKDLQQMTIPTSAATTCM